MVFTCENHDSIVQTKLMQLMEGNSKIKDPFLYFTEALVFPIATHGKKIN